MGDSGHVHGAQGTGRFLLGTVIAGGGACAMTTAASSIHWDARGAAGQEQLILWVLLGLAASGALLCLYLALVWALAAVIRLAGPAGRTGRMLLPALRVLAPRLARRVSTGAAVAGAAAGLVLGPALASEAVPEEAADRPAVLQTSQLIPDEDPAPGTPTGTETPLPALGWGGESTPVEEQPEVDAGEEAPAETDDGADEDAGRSEDPIGDESSSGGEGAGGDEEPAGDEGSTTGEDIAEDEEPRADEPAEADAAEQAGAAGGEEDVPAEGAPVEDAQGTAEASTTEEPPSDGAGAPGGEEAADDAAGAGRDGSDEDGSGDRSDHASRTVVVRPGDSLWSITDDVLGPAPDDPALLASSWPLLHEANLDVIGEDPDLLRPGQVLTVPAALDGEAAS